MNILKEQIVIITGTPRSGSSWLYTQLKAHPNIHAPYKAINYFNSRFIVREESTNHDKGENWYLNQFDPKAGQICADVSNTYFMDPTSCLKIHEFNPNIKIVILIRNPYEGALSHYYQYQKDYNFKGRSFLDVINENYKNFMDGSLVYAGLQPYLKMFKRQQLLFCVYDELKADPKIYLKRIYSFLGVDPSFVPEHILERVNQRQEIKSRSFRDVHSFLTLAIRRSKALSRFRDIFYKFVSPDKVWDILSVNHANSQKIYRDLSTQESSVLKRFYQSDVKKLLALSEFQHLKWELSKEEVG